MGTTPQKSMSQLVGDLARKHATGVKAWETVANRILATALRRKKLKPVRLDTAIFTQIGEGLVVHGPIHLRDDVTKERLRKQPHTVGILMNTVPLVDPITGTALAPGAALVELRPVLGGDYAFDFLADDGRIRFSTMALITNREKFDSIPAGQPLAAYRLPLIDIIISDGSDPDDPLPPGLTVVCISFLCWVKCWIYPRPHVPPPPILV